MKFIPITPQPIMDDSPDEEKWNNYLNNPSFIETREAVKCLDKFDMGKPVLWLWTKDDINVAFSCYRAIVSKYLNYIEVPDFFNNVSNKELISMILSKSKTIDKLYNIDELDPKCSIEVLLKRDKLKVNMLYEYKDDLNFEIIKYKEKCLTKNGIFAKEIKNYKSKLNITDIKNIF